MQLAPLRLNRTLEVDPQAEGVPGPDQQHTVASLRSLQNGAGGHPVERTLESLMFGPVTDWTCNPSPPFGSFMQLLEGEDERSSNVARDPASVLGDEQPSVSNGQLTSFHNSVHASA